MTPIGRFDKRPTEEARLREAVVKRPSKLTWSKGKQLECATTATNRDTINESALNRGRLLEAVVEDAVIHAGADDEDEDEAGADQIGETPKATRSKRGPRLANRRHRPIKRVKWGRRYRRSGIDDAR